MTGYIIKKIIGSWDGCNGYDETEKYTNWIFLSEEKAKSKAAEFNKEYGHYGCGSSLKYVTEVCEIEEQLFYNLKLKGEYVVQERCVTAVNN